MKKSIVLYNIKIYTIRHSARVRLAINGEAEVALTAPRFISLGRAEKFIQ